MSDAFACASDTVLDDFVIALDVLQPDEGTVLRSKYSRIHPAVAAAMARGTSSRQILELLKLKGLDLHHATLNKLFKEELLARDEQGSRVCCVMCGQSLKPKESAQTDALTRESDAVYAANGDAA